MQPFSTSPFCPSWWLPGPHLQTVGARWLRKKTGIVFKRERWDTPDGDFLDLDFVASPAPEDRDSPIALLLHGLEGSTRSGYALQTYRYLATVGIRSIGLNFRSCSGEPNRGTRMYHSGETTDLGLVLETLHSRLPERIFVAVGFSLGANVLLKFLGEKGSSGQQYLDGAVAISVPFDLAAGAQALEYGLSRGYVHPLLRSMHRKLKLRGDEFRGHIDVEAGLASRTFRQFDETVTAPLHGFRDADDYYHQSSCRRFLETIRVPTLVIHAQDDPFLPESAIPRSALTTNSFISAIITKRGGHVGFVSGSLPGRPIFWAEREAARFLSQI